MRFAGLLSKVHYALAVFTVLSALMAPAVAWSADSEMEQSPGAERLAVNRENADIFGRWRLIKVLDSADIAAISDRQARAMVGKQVLITKDRFVIGGRSCRRPTYERSVDDLAKSFREEGHVSSVNMGLPDPVTAIDARCTHIYLKAPERIVIHWDGFYFDAVRLR